MKHLKTKHEKRLPSKRAMILVCLGIGIVAMLGSFGTMYFLNRVSGYREAKEYTDEILSTKDILIEFLDSEEAEIESIRSKYEQFILVKEKAAGYTKNLGASRALKDGRVKELYENALNEFENIEKLADVEKLLMESLADGEVGDVELEQFMRSENDFLRTLGNDLSEYRRELTAFNEKYAKLDSFSKNEVDEAYAAIVGEGEALVEEYEEISLDELVGMSRDDILRFYETIEVLNKYLSTKI